jgi:hypothetical protein
VFCYIASKSNGALPAIPKAPVEELGELIWRYCKAQNRREAGRHYAPEMLARAALVASGVNETPLTASRR